MHDVCSCQSELGETEREEIDSVSSLMNKVAQLGRETQLKRLDSIIQLYEQADN